MATLDENKKHFKTRNNIGKLAKICNFKQHSQRREYLLFQKHIFFDVWKGKMVDQSNCCIWQKFSPEKIYEGYNFMKIGRISEIKASLIELRKFLENLQNLSYLIKYYYYG